MNYDKQKTERYERESQFNIHGYHEELRVEGRQIAQIEHKAIPFGMSLGHLGGGVFSVKEPTAFLLRGKKTKILPNQVISRSIIPICGRVKPCQ